MKPLLSLAVLALLAVPAHADSELQVSIPNTAISFSAEEVSLTLDWDTTNGTFSNFDLILDGSQQLVVEASSFVDPVTGGLEDLDLNLANGDFFQIVQQNLSAPAILPQPGTYYASVSLVFNAAGNNGDGGSLATVSQAPELPTLPLLAIGLLGLASLKRKVA